MAEYRLPKPTTRVRFSSPAPIIKKNIEDTMERKKFNRGTISGGITRIVIAIIAVTIATIVLTTSIKSWDSENIGGGIFMCLIAGIMYIASISFVFSAIKMIIDGKHSIEVLHKGHSENGRILDLSETEVTETNNGCVSHYFLYNLKFEYTDDNGSLCESKEQISEKVFNQLQNKSLVPILVYKQRAVFDRKKFEDKESTKNTKSKKTKLKK